MLVGINRKHPDYMAFKPEKRVQEPVEHEKAVAESSVTKQLEVAEIYKPTSHVKPIFVAVEADLEKYYSASEASDVVFRFVSPLSQLFCGDNMTYSLEVNVLCSVKMLSIHISLYYIFFCELRYVEKENLVKPTDKAKVILDVTLCDALYKGAIKKGTAYPTEIHKKDLGSTFLNRMQVHHIVTRGTQEAIRKGAIRTIQIMTERRQGNKKMTRLSGLECFLMDPDSLASELQKKFACSTTTAELPGNLPDIANSFSDYEQTNDWHEVYNTIYLHCHFR